MRISCSIDDGIQGLQLAFSAIALPQILPILNCVLLKTESDGEVSLSTRNFEFGMFTTLRRTSVQEKGEVATPAQPFLQCLEKMLLSYQPTELVIFVTMGSSFLVIDPSGEEVCLDCMPSTDFFALPARGEVHLCTLLAQNFNERLRQVFFAADVNRLHDADTCVWMQVHTSRTITFAAKDNRLTAIRAVTDRASFPHQPGVFLIPFTTVKDLLPLLTDEGEVHIRVDPQHDFLHLCIGHSSRIIVRLHFEDLIVENVVHYGKRRDFTDIPFIHDIPESFTELFLIPRARLKAIARKQELLHLTLHLMQGGNVELVIERYILNGPRRGQRKGSPVSFPIQAWGRQPFEELWCLSWVFAEIMSAPDTSPWLVLARNEKNSEKLLMRWFNNGAVCQDLSYCFIAEDSYLSRLFTVKALPLSHSVKQVSHDLLQGHTHWADIHVRQPILTRISLLIEKNMRPTLAERLRIVRDPEQLSTIYDPLTRLRDKRTRERRLDQLITMVALQSFVPGGVKINVNLHEELHFEAQVVERAFYSLGIEREEHR